MRRLLAIALLAMASAAFNLAFIEPVVADIPTNIRIRADLTPSGKINTRFRDGDDGSSSIPLVWGTCPNISVFSGASADINLRSTCPLTEPGSPSATVTTTCTPTLGSGWSADADGLAYSGTGNFSATCQSSATLTGYTPVLTNQFTVLSQAPPAGADVTAPTMPLKVTFEPSETGGTLSWDASTDQRATLAGDAPGGVKEYRVRLNGSLIATVPAVSDAVYQFTCSNIGSSTPAPSGTQTGASFALSAGGAGNQGTNWQFYYCYTSLNGPFTASVRLDSVTAVSPTPDLYSAIGLHFNESTTSGSKFIQCARQFTDNSFQCKSKVTTDGSASNKATSASSFLANGAFIRVERDANGLWTAESSTDGNSFDELYTVDTATFSLPAQINAGLSIFSRVNGSAVSGTAGNLSITTAPRMTYAYTGAGGNFDVAAVDQADNVSAYTADVLGEPTGTPTPTGGRAWNTGFYVTTDQREPNTGYTCAQYDILDGNSRWQGAQERIWWEDMEPTRGNYDFSMVDQLAACLSAMGKRLVIQVMDRRFHTTSYTGALPAYLANESGTNCIWQGTATNNSPRTMLRFWYSQCMDREIALYTALYNKIKDMPNVEMVATEEMALGLAENSVDGNPVKGGATGYSRSAHRDQWKRWADTIGPIYQKIGLCHYINGPSGLVDEIHATARANGIGIGGPDIIPDQDPVYSYSILVGSSTRIISPFGLVPNVATHVDSRGQVPICFAVQRPELGGKEGNFTPAQLLNFANGTLKSTHVWFVRHLTPYQTGSDTTWYDMDDYLALGNALTNTSCPTTWASIGCNIGSGGGGGSGTATLTLTSPTAERIYQRIGTTADITIEGTYTGTPNNIQARVMNGSTEVVTWTTIDSSLSGGTFSGTLSSVPQGGMYTAQVRARNSGGTVLGTHEGSNLFGVGAIFAVLGDSHTRRWDSYGQITGNARARKYGGNGGNTWQLITTGTAGHSFTDAAITELNIPVGIIARGFTGSKLSEWNTGTSYAEWNSYLANLASVGGKVEGAIISLGGNDATAGEVVSRAANLTNMRSFVTQVRNASSQASLPIYWIQTPRKETVGQSDTQNDYIHGSQLDLAGDANVYLAASTLDLTLIDGVHLTTASGTIAGSRVGLAVADSLGNDTYHRGPSISSVAEVSATVTDFNMTHRGGTDFTPTSSITGFTVSNNAWSSSVTPSSCVRQDADTIRCTHSSLSGGTRVGRYQAGSNPVITGVVKDNTSQALPLEYYYP